MRLAYAVFMKRETEGWPSGRRRTPGKCVYGKPYRGFESRPLSSATEQHDQRIIRGLETVEALIGFADLYLAPQLFSARRSGAPIDAFPRIRRI